MRESEKFGREEWERTPWIFKNLQEIKKSEPYYSVRNTVNKMLNFFVLFLFKENIFEFTPQLGIDEYGIPFDSCHGDEQTCFAPLDGKITFFRYRPIVGEIRNSLAQLEDKRLEATFELLLEFRKQVEGLK